MRQRGVALISALLVVALATSVAVAMVARQQLDIRRTGNVLQYEQAYLYVQGMESWAEMVLQQDAAESEVDHAGEDWATQLPPIPVEGGAVAGELRDLQGRFNLNDLLVEGEPDDAAVERFRRLLHALELEPELADALLDWLDADLEPRFPGGAEDSVYLGGDNPYRSANGPLGSISELRLLHGVSQEVWQTLVPHVAALPATEPLNVNTATVPVIMSLAEGIDRAAAQALVEARGEEGYADIEAFLQQPELKGRLLPVEALGVESRFFVLTSQVHYGRISVNYQSLLARSAGTTQTVMRAQGVL